MWGRTLGIALGLALAALAWACSDSADDGASDRHTERDARAADVRVSVPDGSRAEADAPSSRDADADAGADADGGAQCCPISPQPACCMEYGGSRRIGGFCGMVCDGMPAPSARWRIAHDEHGCPYWVEPAGSAGCCGCITPDARD